MQKTMPVKKSSKTTKIKKDIVKDKKSIKNIEKKVEQKWKSSLEKATILQKNIKLANEDKMLEKVEKYVDKNREKTSQEMMERKKKRSDNKYKEWDLDVLISRVSIESKPKDKTKKTSKLILYIIYTIIIITILIFFVKFFFAWNTPQNW